jgi:peroxiredoxin Q/BCP
MALAIGDKIPEVLGVDTDGVEVKAADYAGRKFILYFYPKDNTPGCTAEACSFRDNFSRLQQAGYDIVGVSVDNEKSHGKFIEKYELPFRLIADKDKSLVEKFGVWAEKSMAGRKYMGTLRTTFLINGEGVIEQVFTPKEIKTKEHAEQILEWLKQQNTRK